MERQLAFGGILGETAAAIAGAAAYVVALIVALAGLGIAGQMGGAVNPDQLWGFGFTYEDDTTALGLAAALAQLVVQFVGCYFVLARMLQVRGHLTAGGTRIWAYIGLSIVTGIAIMFGLVLLIVPGVILLVRWSAAPGYLIGRGTGVGEAMSKSWDATRGHSWPIFFAGLVLLVVFIGAAVVIGLGSDLAGSATIGEIVAGSIIEAVMTAVSLAFSAAVFMLLDRDVEKFDEVFA